MKNLLITLQKQAAWILQTALTVPHTAELTVTARADTAPKDALQAVIQVAEAAMPVIYAAVFFAVTHAVNAWAVTLYPAAEKGSLT